MHPSRRRPSLLTLTKIPLYSSTFKSTPPQRKRREICVHPQKLLALQKAARLCNVYGPDSMQQLDSKALELKVVCLTANTRLPSSRLRVSRPARVLSLYERAQTLDELLRQHTHARLEGTFPLPLVHSELLALLRCQLGALFRLPNLRRRGRRRCSGSA